MNIHSKSIYEALKNSIDNNGRASFVVSGGSSPVKIFNDLSKSDLDWSKVSVTLVDDRVVSSEHSDSNEKLLKENLFINNASAAKFISLKSDSEEVMNINRPFDIMLLGMGEDGHFASLFPELVDNSNYFDLSANPEIIFTEPMGNPCHKRVSMNLSMIMKSKKIILLVSSSAKSILVDQALENKYLPIHFLLKILRLLRPIHKLTIIKL
jgi:6-phosphogluconolactonase